MNQQVNHYPVRSLALSMMISEACHRIVVGIIRFIQLVSNPAPTSRDLETPTDC